MYQDSASPDRPVDMETDGPLLDDFSTLKKTMEEEATEVRRSTERRAACVLSSVGEHLTKSLAPAADPEGAAAGAAADAEEIGAPQRHLHRHGLGAAPESRGHADAGRPVRSCPSHPAAPSSTHTSPGSQSSQSKTTGPR